MHMDMHIAHERVLLLTDTVLCAYILLSSLTFMCIDHLNAILFIVVKLSRGCEGDS